jgi:hypothetical protein
MSSGHDNVLMRRLAILAGIHGGSRSTLPEADRKAPTSGLRQRIDVSDGMPTSGFARKGGYLMQSETIPLSNLILEALVQTRTGQPDQRCANRLEQSGSRAAKVALAEYSKPEHRQHAPHPLGDRLSQFMSQLSAISSREAADASALKRHIVRELELFINDIGSVPPSG